MTTPRALALTALLVALSGCPPTPTSVCETDAECEDGSSCASGECKPCPACEGEEVCIAARCVSAECGPATCPVGFGCFGGACLASECADLTCPLGQRCAGGACHPASCTDEDCRSGEVCEGGRCVAGACLGVSCAAGLVCANGLCEPVLCGGGVCASGLVCISGACVDTRCVGVACANGAVCAAGLCYPPDCATASCAAHEVCAVNACVDAACLGASCPDGTSCRLGLCDACGPNGCCEVGAGPVSCGVAGSDCVRACVAGTLSECQRPGGPVDPSSDVFNCGACGNVCATPMHAAATCRDGVCGRTPCEAGFVDVDGPITVGCEASCTGAVCTLADGGTLTLSASPLPERGLVRAGLSSSAFAAGSTSDGGMRGSGVLGDPSALPVDGTAASQSGGGARSFPGFGSGFGP